MGKGKLMNSLSMLSPKEWRKFRDLVYSPFFNKHEPTRRFFDYLDGKYPKLTKLDKKECYRFVFQDNNFQEFKVNNLMSYLSNLLDQFLTQLGFEKAVGHWSYNLDTALQKNMAQLFRINYQKAKKALEKQTTRNAAFFIEEMKLNLLYDSYVVNRKEKSRSDKFEQILKSLDTSYIIEKMRLSCEMASRKKIFNKNYESQILGSTFTLVRKNWEYFQETPAVLVYYYIYLLQQQEAPEKELEQLRFLLEKHDAVFTRAELRNIYEYILNFLIEKYNLGETDIVQDIFKIYQQMIAKDLIINNNRVPELLFKNIINTACKVKDFNWAKDFLEDYSKFLSQDSLDNAYSFNLGNIYFNEGNFEKALTLLKQIEFSETFYQLDTKFIQIKCFYELREDTLLENYLQSFRIFILRNKKIPGYQKKSCLKFLRLLRKLANIRSEKGTLSKYAFSQKLSNLGTKLKPAENQFVNKEWLMEKFDEL